MASKIRSDVAVEPSLDVYREPLRRFLAATEKSFADGIPLDRVVETIVGAVEDPAPGPRFELHQNVVRDVVVLRLLPARVRERIARRILGLTDATAS